MLQFRHMCIEMGSLLKWLIEAVNIYYAGNQGSGFDAVWETVHVYCVLANICVILLVSAAINSFCPVLE